MREVDGVHIEGRFRRLVPVGKMLLVKSAYSVSEAMALLTLTMRGCGDCSSRARNACVTPGGFQQQGVHSVGLKDHLNTITAQGRLMFNLFISLAEFERDIIRERTKPA